MPKSPLLVGLFTAVLLAPSAALAQVNHGDFIGTEVDFLQVTETTQSAGDPAVLWDVPSLSGSGDQLLFFPPAFVSSCAAGSSDVTESVLDTTLTAQPGGNIDTIMLAESGDAILTSFPPFGTPATNGSAGLSGTVTVIEDTSGPIAPVVIPFTGTFVPSDTFSLPGNFGTSNWSGNITIDVESQVPTATKAVLSLTNTLTANCAPGNTSVSVQKKVVSGPTVAIAVNPVECALEVEKTCCITQPVLPDLGQCEGDMVSMTLEFTGDKCSASNNDQGWSFRCHGRRSIGEPADISVLYNADVTASPSIDVNHGDEVTFTSSTGTLADRTKIKVRDDWWRKQYLKINTSCEKAFQCGDQFGAFEVTGFESTIGGVVDCDAPPPPPACATSGDPAGTPCDAKVVDMVLEYNGGACTISNPQNGSASCDGNATGATNVGIVYNGHFGYKHRVTPASNINDGDRIRVTSTWRGGLFPNQSYLITDDSGVLQEIGFHTSCSEPLALGDQFGSFTLVEFTTKNGTVAALGDGTDGMSEDCTVPLAPPGPHCTSDLDEITLVYIGDFLGEGCTVSNGQSGYANCSGVDDPGDPVMVTVGSGLDVEPEDQIEFGDLVTISPSGGGVLPWLTTLDVAGSGGSQSLAFKTSCHKPLSLGDRFGSFVVFGMNRVDDGPITLGGNVQYQYKVTNPGTSTVDNVSIDDDQLGNVVSGVSLAPSEMQTFVKAATLFGTTTNVATASGDVGGDLCLPGTDSSVVTVEAPPQGSFRCSCYQSLTEMTVIWDGTETVDLVIWDGEPGTGTQLATADNRAPGAKLSVSGFTEDVSTWEIFDSTGTVKLGESEFNLTCRDKAMNGVEDCGKRLGDGKYDDPGLINDWILEGLVDDDETLSCSPEVVGPPPTCGFGAELALVMPALLWWHRRRLFGL